MNPGDVCYFEDGNGHLPERWYGERLVVVRVVGCWVIFSRADGDVHALPDHCVYPAYRPA